MKTRLLFCFIVLGLMTAFNFESKADAYYWTGNGGNTSWTNTSNWYNLSTLGLTPGYPSTTSDDAYIGVPILFINVFTGSQQPTVNTSITCASLTISNSKTVTLTASSTLTLTGAITISGSATITGTSTVKAASLVFSGSYTLTAGATLINITGAATMNTATVTFVNNASGGSPTLTIGNGTSSFSSLTFTATNPGTVNITGTVTIGGGGTLSVGSGVTMNLTSGSLAEPGFGGTFTNAGVITATAFPFNLNSAINFNNSGTITTYSSVSMEANGTSFTNTGTITINPSASNVLSTLNIYDYNFTFNNTYVSAAFPGIINLNGPTGNTTTLFTISANGGPLTNSGTINATNAPILWSGNSFSAINNNSSGKIILINSPLTISYGTTLTNTGTISATASPLNMGTNSNGVGITNSSTGSISLLSASTFNFPGNGKTFANTGSVTVTSSDMNFTGNTNSWTNTSPGSVVISGSAMAFSTGCGITNNSSALFTVKGGSVMTFNDGTSSSFLTNSGIFNAGISNSSCQITTGTNTSFTITNNSGATFNLGSTSNITFKNTRSSPNCISANSGAFTLESDQYGSASIGQSGTTSSSTAGLNNQFTGSYNVQRYISGGSGNRGYRLLSLPVNSSSNTIGNLNGSGIGNMSLANINASGSAITITNGNAVTGTVNVPGALTGGPSGTTNGFSVTNATPTMYIYNETLATNNSTFTGGKTIGIAAISGATVKTLTGTTTSASFASIPVTTGFMLYFIGNTTSTTTSSSRTPENTIITAVGTINQTDITYKFWNTSASTLSYAGPETVASGKKGYNLVGNPYPCTIDLRQLYLDNSAQGWVNFATVKSLGANQTFAYYNASTQVSSDPTLFTQYIASGQGFFIQATATGQSVTFKEDIKKYVNIGTSTTPPLLMSSPKSKEVLASNGTSFNVVDASASLAQVSSENASGILHLKLEKDSTLNDWCAIAFNKDWQDGYDKNDAYDMDGLAPKVFMSSYTADGVRTGINSLNEIGAGKKVKLYVRSTTDGMYTLKMPDVQNIDLTKYKINLTDNFKKDSLDIGKYGEYNFNITNADTSSFGGNRFVLSIQQIPGPKYQLATFTAQKSTDGILVTWRAYNEGPNYFFTLEKQLAGGTSYSPVYQTQSNGGTIYKYTDKTPNTGNNIYRLKQVDLFGNITYSGPVNIYFDKSGNAGMFSLYPNPTIETLNVKVTYGNTTSAASSYKLNVYDASGTLVMQKTSENNNWSENVSQFKPGVYIVELKSNGGSSLGKAKFVKK